MEDGRDEGEKPRPYSGVTDNNLPISLTEGEALRKRIGAKSYIECSAKTGKGVREVFEAAARAAILPVKPRRPPPHRSFIALAFGMCVASIRNRVTGILSHVSV